MVKLALLLLIAGGLAIFTLQNLAPIAIVILGVKTPALPLAIWVLGMMAAGALTTVLLSGFSSLSKAAVRRSTQPGPRDSQRDRATDTPRSPWSASGSRNSASAGNPFQADSRSRNSSTGAANSRRSVDDWETSPSDDWDDWSEPQPQPASKTRIRDTADDDWAKWDEERNQREESRRRAASETPSPRRASDREPPAQSSAESANYSYREPQDTAGERKKTEVYDAEYRVLIPPYNPTPAPAPTEPVQPEPTKQKQDEEDEDWI